jgi:hypothetical protein
MVRLYLTNGEAEVLLGVDPATRRKGGFQSLLCKLQDQLNNVTFEILVTDTDLERIHRYAFDYGNGGWENKLMAIFQRTLGRRLAA